MGFPSGIDSKKSSCNAGDLVWYLGQGDLLEKGMSTHSSILAWKFPWTREPGGLQPMGLQSWTQLSTHLHIHTRTPNCENKIQGQIFNSGVHFLPFSSQPRILEFFLRLKDRLTHWDFKTKLDTRKKRQWLWQKICLLLYMYIYVYICYVSLSIV